MKKTLLAAGSLLALLTFSGADCLNETFVVPAEVDPFVSTFVINPPGRSYNETDVIDLEAQIDPDLVDDIDGGNVLDITVQVYSDRPGRSFSGEVVLNGELLTGYRGTWNEFRQEKSLRRDWRTYFTPQPSAITRLSTILFKRPLPQVTFVNRGSITTDAQPGDSVTVRVYTQGRARLSTK